MSQFLLVSVFRQHKPQETGQARERKINGVLRQEWSREKEREITSEREMDGGSVRQKDEEEAEGIQTNGCELNLFYITESAYQKCTNKQENVKFY